MTIVNKIMTVVEPEYCVLGSSVTCPVVRPPPRYCVDSQQTTEGSCFCQTKPPDFPFEKFPPPPPCPFWCIFLWILAIALVIVIFLCICACWIGQDDRPKREEKSSFSQTLSYYWCQVLFCIRCTLKKMFGQNCPNRCHVVMIGAVTQVCRFSSCGSKPDNDGSDNNTESEIRSSSSINRVASTTDVPDVVVKPVNEETIKAECEPLVELGDNSQSHSGHTDLKETKIESQPKSNQPMQTETSIAAASPTARTQKVAPAETNGDHNPTPV